MKKIILLLLLSVNFIPTSIAQDGDAKILKRQLRLTKLDTSRVEILRQLSWLYPWSKPDTTILYGMEGRNLSKQLGFTSGEIRTSGALAEALCTKGNFSDALAISFQALQTAEKAGNTYLINYSARSIAGVYYYSGDYAKALVYYLKYKNNRGLLNEVFLGSLGETYYRLHRLDSAFFYIQQAYLMDIKKDSASHWCVPYYYMGLFQSNDGNYHEAFANYKLGLRYSEETTLALLEGYNGIASLFKKTGQIDSSIYYAKKEYALSSRELFIPHVLDATALLTELYAPKNIDSAFKYQRIMLVAKDSLFSQEKVRQLQNLSFNESLRQQERQQIEEEFQNKIKWYALVFLSGISLLIAFILYRHNRQKQKANKELEEAYSSLQSTQSQLIQSEKMASLGELTAGIAHEIQNPLNFVNNFSEVNTELIKEIQDERRKTQDQRDEKLEDELLLDIVQNQEKINHHGKRAADIVKGMLQHSRSSSGLKESTNINTLADEYLRLAYHGLRAKDKSFNATMKTDFDESVGNINIVPQDIGRVILNLITNAFYEVNEKSKQGIAGYDPTVSVSTHRSLSSGEGRGEVLIKVKDNGNGIPQKILDKIFQPFFTTKPTGQGTGLGLSMSYDIVKAHGGEIKVTTKENEGTEFFIQLPIV